jgi:hypothetical protein
MPYWLFDRRSFTSLTITRRRGFPSSFFSIFVLGDCRMPSQELGLKRGCATVVSAGCPKFLGDRKRAQLLLFPPGLLIAAAVKLAMVEIAQGDGELISHICARGP